VPPAVRALAIWCTGSVGRGVPAADWVDATVAWGWSAAVVVVVVDPPVDVVAEVSVAGDVDDVAGVAVELGWIAVGEEPFVAEVV
jgi:hypothetical protein